LRSAPALGDVELPRSAPAVRFGAGGGSGVPSFGDVELRDRRRRLGVPTFGDVELRAIGAGGSGRVELPRSAPAARRADPSGTSSCRDRRRRLGACRASVTSSCVRRAIRRRRLGARCN